MDNLYAKKGDYVIFNGRYDLLPRDIDCNLFKIGDVFTLSADSDPSSSYSFIELEEVPYLGGFNTVAFENIL